MDGERKGGVKDEQFVEVRASVNGTPDVCIDTECMVDVVWVAAGHDTCRWDSHCGNVWIMANCSMLCR